MERWTTKVSAEDELEDLVEEAVRWTRSGHSS